MTPTQEGSIRLFRAAGINVFIHWSWFLVAFWAVDNRVGYYSSPIWNLVEYLGLFLVVLMHEFGHSLAARQVGGHSDTIVLWPFGGVAYVRAPERPGATLWSIAAGPLVNVVLVIALLLVDALAGTEIRSALPDVGRFLRAMLYINIMLLVFNLLPVYPLDGGQMLRSLLWYPLGRVRSLQIATVIGFVGVGALALYALNERSIWMGVMTAFIFMNCRQGWKQAQALAQLAALPRRDGYSCPECSTTPPAGELWRCGNCENAYDPFADHGTCQHCGSQYSIALCPGCGTWNRLEEWRKSPTIIVDAEVRR
jgi:Zn-dependent protease